MKKFTKLFLTCAAVTGLAAAMGTSAMAMTASYNDETGVLTLSDVAYTEGTQQTLLVLNADAETVEESMILGIDQQGAAITSVKLNTADVDVANNTYYVRVGGEDGTIQATTFGATATSDRLLGDVDYNTDIDLMDSLEVAYYSAGSTKYSVNFDDQDTKESADADDTGEIDLLDALDIAYYSVGQTTKSNVDGVKTIADKTNSVN